MALVVVTMAFHQSLADSAGLVAFLRVGTLQGEYEILVTDKADKGIPAGSQVLTARCVQGCRTINPVIEHVHGRIHSLYRVFDGNDRVFAVWRAENSYLLQVYGTADGALRKLFEARSAVVPTWTLDDTAGEQLVLAQAPRNSGRPPLVEQTFNWSSTARTYVRAR